MKRSRQHRGLAGQAAVAYAFAATMLGTALPTPLYTLYQHRFGFSELMIALTVSGRRRENRRKLTPPGGSDAPESARAWLPAVAGRLLA
jgi:hypothetical protein